MKIQRDFLKSDQWSQFRDFQTDQQKRLPPPPLQMPYPKDAPLIDLAPPESFDFGAVSVQAAIQRRESHRQFTEDALTLDELAFLAWATQGVHKVWRGGIAVQRTVPSAGARHPFETYLAVQRVAGVQPGLYRYLSLDHQLCQLNDDAQIAQQVGMACNGQAFIGTAAVVFVWVAAPYRTEWRYSVISPKLIALDAGHVGQNLYLACEALGAGTCAIAAYNQAALDSLLGLDGEDAFAVYVAPVGRL